MDQMLDILVEEDYNERFQDGSNAAQSNSPEEVKTVSLQVNAPEIVRSKVKGLLTRGMGRFFKKPTENQHQPRLSSLTSAIMMYSTELDDDKTFADHKFSTHDNFSTRMESEETVKCISSSIIFFLVIVSIVSLVIINNPVM